jgi:glycogenin
MANQCDAIDERVQHSKEAFVTMITCDDFCPGVEALLASIKSSQSSHHRPVLVMTTSEVSSRVRQKIEKNGGTVIDVDSLSLPKESTATRSTAASTHVSSWVSTAFTKLRLWGLGTEEMGGWKRVVYIDADAIVLEDLNPLFERLCPECPLVAAPDIFPPDRFNAGVLGAELDSDGNTLRDMISKLSELGTYDGGDTGFLNNYFADWFERPPSARLPFRYNAQRTMHWLTFDKQPGYWERCKPIAILHFSSSPKPWQVANKKGELELIWWQHFMEAQIGAGLGADFRAALAKF